MVGVGVARITVVLVDMGVAVGVAVVEVVPTAELRKKSFRMSILWCCNDCLNILLEYVNSSSSSADLVRIACTCHIACTCRNWDSW